MYGSNELLRHPRQIAGWLERAAPETWWPLVMLFVEAIAQDPVLAAVFSQVDVANTDWHLTANRTPPPDLRSWAWAAWASNRVVGTAVAPANHHGAVVARGVVDRAEWVNGHRERLNMMFVTPILALLERELLGLVSFHAAIERWVQRVRWFGLAQTGKATDIKESALQDDLHRFLFDAGYDPADREVQSARGWIDFRVLGADEKRVPVELKRWRGVRDDTHVRKGIRQLRRYMTDQRVPFGYLVVGDVSKTHSLRLPDVLEAEGRTLRLLVAEVRPPAPTVDPRDDHSLSLS